MHILNCSQNANPDWRWLEGKLPADVPTRFTHIDTRARNLLELRLRRPHLARYRAAAQAGALARRGEVDLLVTHGPLMSAWTEFFCAGRRKVPHLAFSFNFTRLPKGPLLAMMKVVLPRIDRFVTFSTMERDLYANTFGIDPSRIDVMLWGVAPPSLPPTNPPFEGDYLCAVGGEGRDYATFMDAMRRLPHRRAVVVARPHNVTGLDVPANVTLRTNIALERVHELVRDSRFMVLPLLHAEVPCGHVTIVDAMYMSKAVIATASRGVADYLRHGENALLVPPADPGALAACIDRLGADDALAQRLGSTGHDFALSHCSERSTVDYVAAYLRSLKPGSPDGQVAVAQAVSVGK